MTTDEFLALAFRATDWLTVPAAFAVGFGMGLTVMRTMFVNAGRAWFLLFLLSTAFYGFLILSRGLENGPTWPAHIGVYLLWQVFGVGMYLALKVPRRA